MSRSAAGEPDFAVWLQAVPGPAQNTEWVKREAATAAEIYGLTDAAYDWLANDVHVHRMVGEPGWAGAWWHNFGIGHPDPWTFMHEAMHVFWGYWDGFPESCDKMNLHTFRRDVLEFREQFHALDNEELENPLEPWRLYYDDLTRNLPEYIGGERLDDIVEREEYWKIWHNIFHIHETNAPMWAYGQPDRLPPQLRRFFDGFLADGQKGDLTVETLRGRHLGGVDGELWDMAYGRAGMPLPEYVRHISDALRTGNLEETERTMLSDAQRQKVVDFFNTLPQVADNGYIKVANNPDCRFGRRYIRQHMPLVSHYAGNLREAEGLEFTEMELGAILRAWSAVGDNPLYGRRYIADAEAAVLDEPGLPAAHRDAILDVLGMIGQYEYNGFVENPRPNFNLDAPFGDPVLVTEPKTTHQDGPQNVVVQIDGKGRVRLEWDLPDNAPAEGSYRSNFSAPCRPSINYTYGLSAPAVLDSGRQRVTWSAHPHGDYQFCVELKNHVTRANREVCHGHIVVGPESHEGVPPPFPGS